MSIYNTTRDLIILREMIDNGDIPEEAIIDTLEAVLSEWDAKADDVISEIKNIRSERDAIMLEISNLMARVKAKEKYIDYLEDAITKAMAVTERDKYESARHRVTFRTSEAVIITDEQGFIEFAKNKCPEAIKVSQDTAIDKSVVKKLLKSGDTVPGAALEKRKNIQIK